MKRLALLPCLLALLSCGDNLTVPKQHDPYEGGTQQPLSCWPNLDGQIDSAELAPTLNTPVSYLVSPYGQNRDIDVAGGVNINGQRTWDWSVEIASDQELKLQASAVEGKWYASAFPSGEFTTPQDASHTLDAVYRHDDEGLWLLGIASVDEAPPEGKTLMVYTDPVALYRFPIKPGDEWVSVGKVEGGMFKGLQYVSIDKYEVKIDAVGTMKLPMKLEFTQALRARTKVTIEPVAGVNARSYRQVNFLFECFGEVARAVSLPDEPNEDFTVASEVRRLGLQP
jgi:hypothetical protein